MGFFVLKSWLAKRPKWLQVAAKHLINGEDLDDATISNLQCCASKKPMMNSLILIVAFLMEFLIRKTMKKYVCVPSKKL